MLTVNYTIDDMPHSFVVEGESEYGSDYVLLDQDDDLLEKVSWKNEGYTVAPFLSKSSYNNVKDSIREIMIEKFNSFDIEIPSNFELQDYHKITNQHIGLHEKIISITRQCFPIERFPIDKNEVVERVSEICKIPLTLKGRMIPEVFCLRICRPEQPFNRDNNPPHRDAWIERLRHGVNIYAPLAGSTPKSSLCIIPKSHHWKESEIQRTIGQAILDGIVYTVPSVTGSFYGLHMIRPIIQENQLMVFSPYTIHGGATNLNIDETRVSLEMRLFRK